MNDIPATTLESIALARPAAAPAAPALPDVFGRPPLLRCEDANLYDALFARVVAAARPRDPFEWILLKDYADLAWEVFRLRRAKAGLVNGMHKNALVVILGKLALDPKPALLFHKDPAAKAAILEQLALHGLDESVIDAEAVVACCDELASLDAMIKSAETRRNAMLREIDYHRSEFATRLREAPDIIDAETEDAPVMAEPRMTVAAR
jgi:hypothetical protein